MVKVNKTRGWGKMLNIIRSMYSCVKSRVKLYTELSGEYDCLLGVRQGECLSPFLFSVFLNDIEDIFLTKGVNGIDVNMLKIFLLLYSDNNVLFASASDDLQKSLNILHDYCTKWEVNCNYK